MAQTIEDWLISLKFQVDQASRQQLEQLVKKAQSGAQMTAEEYKQLEKEMNKTAKSAAKAHRDMTTEGERHSKELRRQVEVIGRHVRQYVNMPINQLTTAIGALGAAVVGFNAFERMVKNLAETSKLSRDLKTSATNIEGFTSTIRAMGGTTQEAVSILSGVNAAVEKNRGILVELSIAGVKETDDNLTRTLKIARFLKKVAKDQNIDLAIAYAERWGISQEGARRLTQLDEREITKAVQRQERWRRGINRDLEALNESWLKNQETLLSNMGNARTALMTPILGAINKFAEAVNKAFEGREEQAAKFLTSITKPIEDWMEQKAPQIEAYIRKITGPEGEAERQAWLVWWDNVLERTERVVSVLGKIVSAIETIIKFASQEDPVGFAATVARHKVTGSQNPVRDAEREIAIEKSMPEHEAEVARRAAQAGGSYTPRKPWLQRFRSWIEGKADEPVLFKASPESPTGVANPFSNPFTPAFAKDVSEFDAQKAIEATRQNAEETKRDVEATKKNTDQLTGLTQEFQQARREGFFSRMYGATKEWIQNQLGMGGGEGGAGAGGGMPGAFGAGGGGAVGGSRTDQGGFEPNAALRPSGDRGGFEPNPAQSRGGAGLVPYKPGSISGAVGINASQWDAFRRGISSIESKSGRYDVYGGSAKRVPGGRFAGRYQLGGQEIINVAKSLGETPPITYKNGVAVGSQAFLNDPQMQERYFERFTQMNHEYLQKNSAQYRALSPEKKLQALGYAHNQGAPGAARWLNTGVGGRDAFGTAGTAYNRAVARELGLAGRDNLRTPQGTLASVRGSGTGQNLASLGANPVISEIVGAAAAALPQGYTIRTTSGHRPNQSYGFHPKGMANDFQIYDPQGKPIPNRGGDPTGLYTRLARAAYAYQLEKHPELTGKFAWGGAFGTVPGGKVQDLMHFDIGGERGHILANRLSNLGPLPGFMKPETAAPIETPASNDNSRTVNQNNTYNMRINAQDARSAANAFKGSAEQLNSITMGQARGAVR